jgi:hypothetical protein
MSSRRVVLSALLLLTACGHLWAPPRVARVVCDRGAVRFATPVVQARRDGVMVVVENRRGTWGVEFHPRASERGGAVGGVLRPGVNREAWPLTPGAVTVACLRTARSSYFQARAETATIAVVDLDGNYVPTQLACGPGRQFRMVLETRGGENPFEAFRRVPGVRAGDVLEHPMYRRSALVWPTAVVFRNGRAIAHIGGPVRDGRFQLFVNSCPRSGIGPPAGATPSPPQEVTRVVW